MVDLAFFCVYNGDMKLNIDKIKNELRRIDKTQMWLASQVGVSKQAVSHWMGSPTSITFKNIEKVAKVFNLDEKDLLL